MAKLRQYFTRTFEKTHFYLPFVAMANNVLDVGEMRDSFFAESALIGVSAAIPAYRFCWLVNKILDMCFENVPENLIEMNETRSGKETFKQGGRQLQVSMFDSTPEPDNDKTDKYFFSTFLHKVPNSSHSHLLYQLKSGKKTLLPEAKHLDYLWLVQTAEPEHDAHIIMERLRVIPTFQLVQAIDSDLVKKSLANLLV